MHQAMLSQQTQSSGIKPMPAKLQAKGGMPMAMPKPNSRSDPAVHAQMYQYQQYMMQQ
jgi:hypothetical protein